MRLIKLGILSFIILFFVATAISLMIPSHIRISKAANFHVSKRSYLLAAVGNQENWQQWHPAYINDSLKRMKSITVRNQLISDSEVVVQMQQGNKPAVINGWKIHSFPNSDSLTLQWYMDFRLKWYPWQKFGSLFYENTYGRMMEEGLSNLKLKADSLQ